MSSGDSRVVADSGVEVLPLDNVLLFIRLNLLRPRPAAAQPLDYTPRHFDMTSRATLYRWDELALDKVTEMVARKVIVGTETTLTQAYFKKGAIVPLHTHPTEVVVYVLQGAVRVQMPGVDAIVREGEVLVVPPNVAHQSESLDDTFVLTVAGRSAPGTVDQPSGEQTERDHAQDAQQK